MTKGRSDEPDDAVPDVVGSLWRAIAIPRFVTLAFAVAVNLVYWRDYESPLGAWLVVTAIAIWTLVATWAYDAPRRRRWWLLWADLAVAVGALAAGRLLLGDLVLREGVTIPGFWVISPVLAWGIHRSWPGGIFAAIVVAGADLGFRTDIVNENYANVFLTFLAGGAIGFWATMVRNAAAERARHAEFVARTAERERLARAVHDGVLQVLAYVQRRGAEIGGETAVLAREAGEQEAILRALVQGDPVDPEEPGGETDVAGLLRGLATANVSVAAPANPVLLPGRPAHETVAAVRAAIDNVEQHAGDAKAYVLVEDEDDRIVISIRDDGPGMPPERLAEAEADGRMGVSRSIIGRVREVGGTAEVSSSPGAGTEWTLRIPRFPKSD